jgi:hypothetical protein
MKTLKKQIVLIIISVLVFSCQDVIQVDLSTAAPKLVVEARINWQKGTTGNIQKIKLTTTTSYYSSEFPIVSGANVSVQNAAGTVFSFIENAGTGEYICNNFVPVIDETYTLMVVSNGQTYKATETLKSVAPIINITQKNDGGFLGKDIEVKAFYKDPPVVNNFYLYNYNYPTSPKPDYYVGKDELYQGNEFFSISRTDKLKVGDLVTVSHFGVSEQYYNYLAILLDIAGSAGGGPFQSPPATVRGNVVNQTNRDNYPLGYFSLSEFDTRSYTIQ